MKKNGFTLVELLAVLAIIAIVGLIIVPTVDRAIKKSRQELYNVQVNNIKSAAKEYMMDNLSKLPDDTNPIVVLTLKDLFDGVSTNDSGGYLERPIENPINRKNFDENQTIITVKKENKSYIYEVTTVDVGS